MSRDEQRIKDIFRRSFPKPSAEQTESGCERVFQRLTSLAADSMDAAGMSPATVPPRRIWPWAMIGAAAALAVLAFLALPFLKGWIWPAPVYATVIEGSVEHDDGGRTLRTNASSGAVIALPDSSRVEMRSQSELSLEPADNALRIHLTRGGLLVTSARQGAKRLYVQTKDVVVSVDGTVFLVKAGEQGSRVAVLEGEVQVQTGSTDRKLRPGEEVSTNPVLQSPPLVDELRWSRNAAALLALQEQPVVPPPPPLPQTASEPRVAFEVASVRAGDVAPQRTGRGGALPFGFGCGGSFFQLDPGRFVVSTNLFTLVAMAYGKDCVSNAQLGLLTGGPGWVISDQYTIQAVIPPSTPAYTRYQLMTGNAPKLQAMIQTLLAERFKLAVHRENREMFVYALTIAKGGPKLQPAPNGNCDPNSALIPRAQRGDQKPACIGGFNVNRQGHFNVFVDATTIGNFAQILTGALERPVIDRTGLAGVYDFHFESSVADTMFHEMKLEPTDNPPSVFEAIQQQLGLKLESTKGPVEVLVIDRAEKPSEN